jgi:hypothetical protein
MMVSRGEKDWRNRGFLTPGCRGWGQVSVETPTPLRNRSISLNVNEMG